MRPFILLILSVFFRMIHGILCPAFEFHIMPGHDKFQYIALFRFIIRLQLLVVQIKRIIRIRSDQVIIKRYGFTCPVGILCPVLSTLLPAVVYLVAHFLTSAKK